MSERSLFVSPVVETCAGGVIGMGVGYTLAPRKYSLKGLLSLTEDKFEKIYSKDLAENLSVKQRVALSDLVRARKAYRTGHAEVAKDVSNAASTWARLFSQVDIPENLRESHINSRRSLIQAIKENNYIELNQQYRAAKAALLASPEDEALKIALNNANAALANAKTVVGPKIEVYKSLTRDIQKERLLNIKNNPVKYVDVKDAYHNFIAALAKKRTAASNKLYELSSDKHLIKCYEKLYDFLPKARNRSVVSGALIFGSATAYIVSRFNRAVVRKSA